MTEIFSLLDELNIDEEFKIVLRKVSNLINYQLNRAKWALKEDEKLQHISCAEMFVGIIDDCYPNNSDYQNLIIFIKDDIETHRFLIKKNSSDIDGTTEDKPIYH